MKSKISIIVPCYNVQKYVMRCFESVYNQTYGFENLEVIFIDDMSTDNTYSMIDALHKKYPKNVISLKMNEKGMEGGCRNLGMDFATGRYIAFLDSDDCMHPKMLDILYRKMKESDYDIVQCGAKKFDSFNPHFDEVNSDDEESVFLLDNINERKDIILKCTGGFYMCAWGKLFSREFLRANNIRFIEKMYFVDNHFSIICALLANKYCSIKQELLYYYENHEGITNSNVTIEKIRDLSKMTVILNDEIKKWGIGDSCSYEIQAFVLWKAYFEAANRLEAVLEHEKEYYKSALLSMFSRDQILSNPYIKSITNDNLLKKIEGLKA